MYHVGAGGPRPRTFEGRGSPGKVVGPALGKPSPHECPAGPVPKKGSWCAGRAFVSEEGGERVLKRPVPPQESLRNREGGTPALDVCDKAYAMNPWQKDEARGELPCLREHRRDRPKAKFSGIWLWMRSASFSRRKGWTGSARTGLLPGPSGVVTISWPITYFGSSLLRKAASQAIVVASGMPPDLMSRTPVLRAYGSRAGGSGGHPGGAG